MEGAVHPAEARLNAEGDARRDRNRKADIDRRGTDGKHRRPAERILQRQAKRAAQLDDGQLHVPVLVVDLPASAEQREPADIDLRLHQEGEFVLTVILIGNAELRQMIREGARFLVILLCLGQIRHFLVFPVELVVLQFVLKQLTAHGDGDVPPQVDLDLGQHFLEGQIEAPVDFHYRYLELYREALAKHIVEYLPTLVHRRVHRALQGLDAGLEALGGVVLAEGEERRLVLGDLGLELPLPLAAEYKCVSGTSVRTDPLRIVVQVEILVLPVAEHRRGRGAVIRRADDDLDIELHVVHVGIEHFKVRPQDVVILERGGINIRLVVQRRQGFLAQLAQLEYRVLHAEVAIAPPIGLHVQLDMDGLLVVDDELAGFKNTLPFSSV